MHMLELESGSRNSQNSKKMIRYLEERNAFRFYTWIDTISVRGVSRGKNRYISNHNMTGKREFKSKTCFIHINFQHIVSIQILPAVNRVYVPKGRVLENDIGNDNASRVHELDKVWSGKLEISSPPHVPPDAALAIDCSIFPYQKGKHSVDLRFLLHTKACRI